MIKRKRRQIGDVYSCKNCQTLSPSAYRGNRNEIVYYRCTVFFRLFALCNDWLICILVQMAVNNICFRICFRIGFGPKLPLSDNASIKILMIKTVFKSLIIRQESDLIRY